ncbi:hypothetical protein ACFSTA_05025 [Ornithinibacillus salinisoli]|uniref:GapA-binding peptide SR1P n=1 Tax=Ornithinibacillus salinisoli TaxID=1848459 RepID=A0ABW4VYT9_9BACI
MRELIGTCESCGREVYCDNGFFDGVHDEGTLLCHQCNEGRED